ncbi:hypothetical protein ACN38_g11954 [Penicillium nordicum]|uniref:Uncharacterized protein n=1 Tax=Penicillium nordicum TaxID=229535 RepID=A0A0M8NZ07_9EURO|nr:hypothetical protein ACN38_g11954 [Penicillium nordicum]
MTDSGFSWMLGGGRNLSGFVSSTSPPPEQTRHLDQSRGKPKPNALFGLSGDDNPGTDSEHSELALHSLRGSRDPLARIYLRKPLCIISRFCGNILAITDLLH